MLFRSIGASIVALWLAFHTVSALQRTSAGLVMGAAISGMHYAAMQGSSFMPGNIAFGQAGHAAVGQAPLAFDIAADRRLALLEGLDETLVIRRLEADIAAFQTRDAEQRPWIYARDLPG